MKKYLLSLLASLLLGTSAFAAQIQYIQTGVGSGTLDGNGFGSLAPLGFTIRATGDTSTIQSCGSGCVFIDNQFASIEIATLGTFQILTPSRFFSNSGIVGFSRAGIDGTDLHNMQIGTGWDMTTSFGPVPATGFLSQWALLPLIGTSSGILQFNDSSGSGTFQAIVGGTSVVPVPGSLLLLGSSFAALLVFGRRRKIAAA